MTIRWKIIKSETEEKFYKKIADAEAIKYELVPESFTVGRIGIGAPKYFVLMKKEVSTKK